MKISEVLSYGQENALPMRSLRQVTGLSEREARRQIERERRSGILIVSDTRHGYWLTDDPAEAARFSRSIRHRAREILRTAAAIEGAAGIE